MHSPVSKLLMARDTRTIMVMSSDYSCFLVEVKKATLGAFAVLGKMNWLAPSQYMSTPADLVGKSSKKDKNG